MCEREKTGGEGHAIKNVALLWGLPEQSHLNIDTLKRNLKVLARFLQYFCGRSMRFFRRGSTLKDHSSGASHGPTNLDSGQWLCAPKKGFGSPNPGFPFSKPQDQTPWRNSPDQPKGTQHKVPSVRNLEVIQRKGSSVKRKAANEKHQEPGPIKQTANMFSAA